MQLLKNSYLVIYSNQDSISLCLKSCKVCLKGAVRAFHLAAQGPYPCCKGQLSNARTVREIIKLTQLEPRLGRLPGLRGTLPAQRLSTPAYHHRDSRVTVARDSSGQGEGEGGTKCPAIRYPKNVPQALPAAAGGGELAVAGAPSTEQSARAGVSGGRRQSVMRQDFGTGCPVTLLACPWKWGVRGKISI